MKLIKNIFKNKGARAWAITTIVLVLLFTVVTILSSAVHSFYELLNMTLPGGGPRAVYKDGIVPIYVSEHDSKKEVYDAARDMNREICREGMVLLKNKDSALPLQKGSKISVFGKNSVNIAYGGSGSGGGNTSNVIDLYTALERSGFVVNPALKSFYENERKSGPTRKGNTSDLDSGDTVILSTAETPISMYGSDVINSYNEYNDAAVIVITRIGGEGFDMPRIMTGSVGARNEDDHFLQLDANEEALIADVCARGFEKIVIAVNSGQVMELGFAKEESGYVDDKGYDIDPAKIDAVIWMGFPGETGTLAFGDILCGDVNPSGRLADTYATDLKKDPTWYNFGDNRITAKGKTPGGDQYVFDKELDVPYYFVDYEEGVYVGYKYYETRGITDGDDWYGKNVVYPFGYGLSYTNNFTWTVEDASSLQGKAIEKNKKYKVKVKVTNDGTVAGKDVVQLYAHAPYIAGEIEKPEVMLVDFAKTPLLYPLSESNTADKPNSAVVELEFDPYFLASYDYKDQNHNGHKTFELDGGDDYALYVNTNAHDRKFEIPFKVSFDIIYDKDTVTGKNNVENRYTDCADARFDSDTSLETVLSRSAWDETFPVTPTENERKGSKELLTWLSDKSHNNPNNFKGLDMPLSEEENGFKLRDLLFDDDGKYIGLDDSGIPHADYNDERWELLIDQCSVSEMKRVYDYASYKIEAVSSIGLPRVNCADGPVGWSCFMDKTRFYDTCSYCSQTLVATTYNKEIAFRFGESVGEEGIIGNYKGDRSPYSGWYAPGVNIHRSPFGGRNFEYYSEDSMLSGIMAAEQIKGCNSKGVFTFVKHFAVNEQETHRSISGDCSWLTEQSMREIYLRPFELAVKNGGSRAMMTSFNRIGTRWTGGDYRLLTDILRNEWGFRGAVISDFNTIPEYMNSRQMAYAGGDLNLATQPVSWCDESSVADVTVLRQCFKNTLYAVVNSNAMNGEVIGFKMPIWQIVLIVFDCLLIAGLGVWGYFVIAKLIRKDKSTKLPQNG